MLSGPGALPFFIWPHTFMYIDFILIESNSGDVTFPAFWEYEFNSIFCEFSFKIFSKSPTFDTLSTLQHAHFSLSLSFCILLVGPLWISVYYMPLLNLQTFGAFSFFLRFCLNFFVPPVRFLSFLSPFLDILYIFFIYYWTYFSNCNTNKFYINLTSL